MNDEANSCAESDADILTFDVSDTALEHAAMIAEGQAITIGHCTHWWYCTWPM
jgi:hypothetical protein